MLFSGIFNRSRAEENEVYRSVEEKPADTKTKKYDAELLKGITDESTAVVQLAGYIPFSPEAMEAIRANETRLMEERNDRTKTNLKYHASTSHLL